MQLCLCYTDSYGKILIYITFYGDGASFKTNKLENKKHTHTHTPNPYLRLHLFKAESICFLNVLKSRSQTCDASIEFDSTCTQA